MLNLYCKLLFFYNILLENLSHLELKAQPTIHANLVIGSFVYGKLFPRVINEYKR